MKQTISIKLFNTLQKGKNRLGKEALERVIGFVETQRTEEDSFMDKSGKADLYYTAFGWMLSYVLGIKLNRDKTRSYLDKQDIHSLDLIHYAAYMRLRMIRSLSEGGKASLLFKALIPTEIKGLQEFTGVPHNDRHSPYTQFIWLSLLEDTKFRLRSSRFKVQSPNIEPGTSNFEAGTSDFDLSPYHVEGGGYLNTPDGLTPATNATVAALAIRGQLAGYRDNTDIRFLRNLQEPSGGFAAAKASPLPDLLSTATSLFILDCYRVKPVYEARDFIEAHWLDSGGFSATLLDEVSDVEYTFYGLLALGSIGN